MFNEENNLVKDKLEIYNLLKNIQKSRQLISLSLESLPHHSITSLLKVHHDSQVITFDEPNPILNNKLAATKDEATFSLKLSKVDVLFKAKLIVGNRDENINELYVHYPKEIYYAQNRGYYRFNTEDIDEINTTVYLSATKRIPAQLVNISLNGLCLRFPYSYASVFQVNHHIDDIFVELPNQNGFSVSAKVQNARIENNYQSIIIGLEIQKQKANVEKNIQQFIFRSENI